jgi:hypothetical protein
VSRSVYANLAIASLVWATPFVALAVYWMRRARKENDLGIARFLQISVRTGVLLLFLGGISFLIIFRNQPGPDAGLAVSVGLAFSAIGALIVWAISIVLAFAILRAPSLSQE